MTAELSGAENCAPKQEKEIVDWDDGPSHCARVRIEKSDIKFDMELPLLDASIYTLSIVGAVTCPWLTFREAPATLPTWTTLGIIIAQLLLLGFVVTAVRNVKQVNKGSREVG